MEENICSPFWDRAVTLFPMWMAPNMITLIGFMALTLPTLLSLSLNPTFDLVIPGWIFILAGVMVFVY